MVLHESVNSGLWVRMGWGWGVSRSCQVKKTIRLGGLFPTLQIDFGKTTHWSGILKVTSALKTEEVSSGRRNVLMFTTDSINTALTFKIPDHCTYFEDTTTASMSIRYVLHMV